MTGYPKKRPGREDVNQTAYEIVQQATVEGVHASEGEKDDRCSSLWNGKRCKLRTGHFEVHQFDL